MTKPQQLSKLKKDDHHKLVIKDNALIMSSYSLSVEEQRLILACIEKSQREKQVNQAAIEVILSVHEYSELYGVAMKTAYGALSNASDRLYDRSIRIEENGVRRKVRWLQEQATYDSGKVQLIFSQTVSKHINEIVTQRTAYRLAQATQLRSQHSIRMFEILQTVIDSNTQQGIWDVSINELKEMFEVQGNYPRWADFKRKVILDSVNNINKNTSLKVDWSVIGKNGKKIDKLRFTVFESNQLSLGLK